MIGWEGTRGKELLLANELARAEELLEIDDLRNAQGHESDHGEDAEPESSRVGGLWGV